MTDMRQEFEERGYSVIRGLLSPDEAACYRAEVQRLSGVRDEDFGRKVFTCPDGITQNPPFWPLIYHERLLGAIRTLIGPTVRYTQHSDLHAHVARNPPAPGASAAGTATRRAESSTSAPTGTSRWPPTRSCG